MVDRPRNDLTAEVVDPVTKKPLHEQRVNSLVVGPEPEQLDVVDGPEPGFEDAGERSRDGVQHIVHIEDPANAGDAIAAAKRALFGE